MSSITIIYWRDIPTQIVIGKGRKALKHQLPDRFMVAVDKAAMIDGASDTEAYLAGWHKVPLNNDEPDDQTALISISSEFENNYPGTRLALLVKAGGREQNIAE